MFQNQQCSTVVMSGGLVTLSVLAATDIHSEG